MLVAYIPPTFRWVGFALRNIKNLTHKRNISWGFVRFEPIRGGTIPPKLQDSARVFMETPERLSDRLFNIALSSYPNMAKLERVPHITIIESEDISDYLTTKEKFDRLISMDGTLCYTFEYNTEFKDNGKYVWVEIDCRQGNSLRHLLGVSHNSRKKFHLLLGNIETTTVDVTY